jgi:hypothetical protein
MAGNAKSRSEYWEKHITPHPAGEGDFGTWLRQELMAILARYSDADERKRRSWVAQALAVLGVKYPNEKKHKKRFLRKRTAPAA